MDLQEDPKHLELLYEVLATVVDTHDPNSKSPIGDLDIVNYILASALKADIIEPLNLGLVLMYL